MLPATRPHALENACPRPQAAIRNFVLWNSVVSSPIRTFESSNDSSTGHVALQDTLGRPRPAPSQPLSNTSRRIAQSILWVDAGERGQPVQRGRPVGDAHRLRAEKGRRARSLSLSLEKLRRKESGLGRFRSLFHDLRPNENRALVPKTVRERNARTRVSSNEPAAVARELERRHLRRTLERREHREARLPVPAADASTRAHTRQIHTFSQRNKTTSYSTTRRRRRRRRRRLSRRVTLDLVRGAVSGGERAVASLVARPELDERDVPPPRFGLGVLVAAALWRTPGPPPRRHRHAQRATRRA